MSEGESELNKATGDLIAERLTYVASQATEQLIKTSGWLTASLLAINGGGALATINIIERLEKPFLTGGLFGFGILFAMLNAVAIQAMHARGAAPLETLIGYWTGVKVSGIRNLEYETEAYAPVARLKRLSFVPPVIGWISGAFFFAGAAMLAWDAQSRAMAIDHVCGGLQAKMLSASPSPESRELFNSLKCRVRLQ